MAESWWVRNNLIKVQKRCNMYNTLCPAWGMSAAAVTVQNLRHSSQRTHPGGIGAMYCWHKELLNTSCNFSKYKTLTYFLKSILEYQSNHIWFGTRRKVLFLGANKLWSHHVGISLDDSWLAIMQNKAHCCSRYAIIMPNFAASRPANVWSHNTHHTQLFQL